MNRPRMPIELPMTADQEELDQVDEVAANLRILIAEELDVQHRLGGHPVPVPDCPVCRAHAT